MGDRHDPGGDECTGARRRGTCGVLRIPRVAHRSDAGMLGRTAEAELRHLRLTQWHQSGTQEHLGERAVGGHRARIPRVGALHRGHALDGDVVLDERRHPVEVAAERARRRGPGPGTVERHIRQTVQHRVDRLGAGDRRVDEFGRRHSARSQCLDQTDGIKVAQRVVAESVTSVCSWAVSLIAAHAATVPSRTADV